MRARRSEPWEMPGPGCDPLGSAAGLRAALLQPAGSVERVLHVAVDAVVLLLLLAVPAVLGLVGALLTPAGPLVVLTACALGTLAVLVGVAVVWPAHDGGRTAGMRWAGLRVVDSRGRAPRAGALAVRTLVLPVDLVVGPVLVAVRDDRRRLGDLLAGTRLVHDAGAVARPSPVPSPRPLPAAAPRTARAGWAPPPAA